MKKGFINVLFIIVIIVIAGGIGYFISNTNRDIDSTEGVNDITTSLDKTIDLSNKGLKSIPYYIFDQTNIEELNVSNNSLTGAIQAEIGHLSKLKILNAKNNLMTGVPAEIGQLQNLEILDLSNNQLTGLPNELGSLRKLKILNLSGNQYSNQDLKEIRAKLPKTVNIILN